MADVERTPISPRAKTMRRLAGLALTLAAPTVTACASSTAVPLLIAQAEPRLPPVPAELLAATNGKADAPFQVEAEFALAAQMQRETAARRAQATAPVLMGAASAPAPAPVRLAEAAPPASPRARPSATASAVKTSPRPLASKLLVARVDDAVADVADLPRAPIPYLELVRIDTASDAATPPPATHVAAGPAVKGRPAKQAMVARLASASPPAARATAFIPAPEPRRVVAVARAQPARSATMVRAARPVRPMPVISRIRAYVSNWLNAIRA